MPLRPAGTSDNSPAIDRWVIGVNPHAQVPTGRMERRRVSPSYVSSLYHCVWSTKQRRRMISAPLRDRLWPYLTIPSDESLGYCQIPFGKGTWSNGKLAEVVFPSFSPLTVWLLANSPKSHHLQRLRSFSTKQRLDNPTRAGRCAQARRWQSPLQGIVTRRGPSVARICSLTSTSPPGRNGVVISPSASLHPQSLPLRFIARERALRASVCSDLRQLARNVCTSR